MSGLHKFIVEERRGIVLEISELSFYKKHGYLEYPKIIQLEITKRCPLHCPQCYKDLVGKQDIDYIFLKKFIENESKNGLRSIMVNGGEPLCYPYFCDFLQEANFYGIKTNVFTSGFGLNKQVIDAVVKNDCFLNISLNGSTNEINKYSRDGYEYAMKAIQLLYSMDAKYGINWVARRDNVKDFPNIIKLAERYNANNILIVGNKISHLGNVQEAMELEDYVYLVNVIKKYNNSKGKVQLLLQRCFTTLNDMIQDNVKGRLNKGCSAGISSIAMNVAGEFMPCAHMYYPEKFASVNEYWLQSKILKEFRKFNIKSGLCVDCLRKENCFFCRAAFEESYNDFSRGVNTCLINKYHKTEGRDNIV
ncbi:MAG: radical SAM protein [Lachnospiraceae bacterium]|nr:radical SAM protein [Lachnospiraceae bacterium]